MTWWYSVKVRLVSNMVEKKGGEIHIFGSGRWYKKVLMALTSKKAIFHHPSHSRSRKRGVSVQEWCHTAISRLDSVLKHHFVFRATLIQKCLMNNGLQQTHFKQSAYTKFCTIIQKVNNPLAPSALVWLTKVKNEQDFVCERLFVWTPIQRHS